MPKRTKVSAHVEPDELERRYRQAHDPVERRHFQVVWLLAQGKTRAEVTGYSERWIGEVIRRYNQEGSDALGDQRHDNPGGRPILNPEQHRHVQADPEEIAAFSKD